MAPDELAARVAHEIRDRLYDDEGDQQLVAPVIAAAIREAVAAERERLLEYGRVAVAEWQADIAAGSLSSPLLQGMIDGVNIVMGRIIRGEPPGGPTDAV